MHLRRAVVHDGWDGWSYSDPDQSIRRHLEFGLFSALVCQDSVNS